MTAADHRLRWRAAPLALAACGALALLAGACGKDKDSLVIVGITAPGELPSATSAEIAVGANHQTFALAGLSATTAVRRGLYVDSKTVGNVSVQATVLAGTPCLIYSKSGTVNIPSAGATVEIALALTAVGPCTPGTDAGVDAPTGSGGAIGGGTGGSTGGGTGGRVDAGAGGAGTGGRVDAGAGGAGTGGRVDAGAGGAGTGGRVDAGTAAGPSLASCVEYNHSATTDCTTDDHIVYSVAVSPNGQLVATGGNDHRVKIWSFDGKTLTTPVPHILPGMGGYGMLAFSPDGTMLAVGWSTGIDIWSTSTWIRQRTLLVADVVYDLAFTPDGAQIMSIDASGNLYAHNIGTTAALHTLAIPEQTWYLAVSPASSSPAVVAVATQMGTVRVFTHTSAGFVAVATQLNVTSTDTHPLSVAFSRDGRYVAAGNGSGQLGLFAYPVVGANPTAPIIDVGTPTLSGDVNGIAFSPDNLTLAAGGGCLPSISTWPIAGTRTNIATTFTPTWDVYSITYSPNGKALIAGEHNCGLVMVCAD
jgi:WD40 repeat protein